MKGSVSVVAVLSVAVFFLLCFPVFSQEAIQVQPSSDGKIEASVTQAKVRGNVLTVMIKLKNTTDGSLEPELRFQEFYVTDVKDKKKYFPLKDSKGVILAGPQHYDWGGGTFKGRIKGGEFMTIWAKFPAPPEATETVDLFIPGIMPFEDLPLSRSPAKE
ncbi:MAG: hypothetical protein GX443_01660 [Deltaproteobacteria bacterium]|nr:hypothetical protein [Deltaproteobacteria bacterium]